MPMKIVCRFDMKVTLHEGDAYADKFKIFFSFKISHENGQHAIIYI